MAPTAPSDVYFGAYVRFETPSKKDGAVLAGPDIAVGDIGQVVMDVDEHKHPRAWLKNPYGKTFAFLGVGDSRKAALLQAKGWTLRYVMSFTAYSESPDPGVYWGQVALIAYAPRYEEAFGAWLKLFAARAAEGLRPDPSLNAANLSAVLRDPSSWQPNGKVKIPKGDGRTAILKDHRTAHDKLLDKSRSRNVGCYIVSWAFILGVVALAAYAAHMLGLF